MVRHGVVRHGVEWCCVARHCEAWHDLVCGVMVASSHEGFTGGQE